MKGTAVGEGGLPFTEERGQVLTRCQKEESLRQRSQPTHFHSISSGTGRRQQWLHCQGLKPAFPCRRQASFASSHQMSEFSLNHPLCHLKAVFSVPVKCIFSWLFLSFTPEPTNSSIRAWEDARSTHSLRGPNHRHPDPGHNSPLPCSLFVSCQTVQTVWLVLEKHLDPAHYLGGPLVYKS